MSRLGRTGSVIGLLGLLLWSAPGCGPRLTAIPVSPRARAEMGADHGIPYYVPRPFLLVTRNIEVSDDALVNAGIVADAGGNSVLGSLRSDKPAINTRTASGAARSSAGADGATPSVNGGGAGGSGSGGVSSLSGGVSSLGGGGDDGGDESTAASLVPTYRIRVVYLPDLSRQYALQQRGAGFGSTQIKYELEGGWMFKGTEISSESKLPEVIEATTSGVASVLGASMEQVFASLFPIPQPDSGVSAVGSGSNLDLSPRIWLFEIQADDRGQLSINTQKPFFEWPPRQESTRRVPVDVSRDPGPGDVAPPGVIKPTGKRPGTSTGPGTSAQGSSGAGGAGGTPSVGSASPAGAGVSPAGAGVEPAAASGVGATGSNPGSYEAGTTGGGAPGLRAPTPGGGRGEAPVVPSYNYFSQDGSLWM